MLERLLLKYPILIASMWGTVIGLSFFGVYQHEFAPGSDKSSPIEYPVCDGQFQQKGKATLIVFLHPYCPCSHATVTELERIVSRSSDRIVATAIFWHPAGTTANWHETALWRRTNTIQGIRAFEDIGGGVTKQFGATTSGQAMLYDRDGRRRFSGGITPSRGHCGDNAGSDAIYSLLISSTRPDDVISVSTDVFGCRLVDQIDPAISEERQR